MNPWSCARTNDLTSMHHFPRCKDPWVAVILALNLLHRFSFFRKVWQQMWQAFFLKVRPKIYPAAEKNASFFFEKIFLKDICPPDHTLQQHKTVLQIAKNFFLDV